MTFNLRSGLLSRGCSDQTFCLQITNIIVAQIYFGINAQNVRTEAPHYEQCYPDYFHPAFICNYSLWLANHNPKTANWIGNSEIKCHKGLDFNSIPYLETD